MNSEKFIKLLYKPELLNATTMLELTQLIERYPWFQGAKVLLLKNKELLNNSDYHNYLNEVALAVPHRNLLAKYLRGEINFNNDQFLSDYETENAVYQLEAPELPEEGNSLIDKFLQKQGSAPIKVKLKQPVAEETSKKLIEQSTQESDELITETLAKLYKQQKKYNKAIEAYRKLSLKYPEKNIYFAARIKEIEEIIKKID